MQQLTRLEWLRLCEETDDLLAAMGRAGEKDDFVKLRTIRAKLVAQLEYLKALPE